MAVTVDKNGYWDRLDSISLRNGFIRIDQRLERKLVFLDKSRHLFRLLPNAYGQNNQS
ncbi:hypothetical protein D3C78_1972470 [compost metagenome]